MKYKPLDEDGFKLFVAMSLCEKEGKDISEMKNGLMDKFNAPAVVQKRIDVLDLPISFNDYALVAISCFAKVPGEAVLLLIDALNKYENQKIDMDKLTNLYPFGFYDYASLTKIIDGELKTRKRKWSEIY